MFDSHFSDDRPRRHWNQIRFLTNFLSFRSFYQKTKTTKKNF